MITSAFSGLSSNKLRVVASQKAAALLVMLLGAVFIAVVGFLPVEAVHNAAHDTRHAAAFPCH